MSISMPFHQMEEIPFIYNPAYNRSKEHSPTNPHLLPDGSPIPPPRHSTAHIDRDTVSPERAKHLERNRIAANKCREKKKLSNARMNLKLDAQSSRNKALKSEVECLREELWLLKNQLFDHVLCENKLVDSYLGDDMAAQQQDIPTESTKCPSPSFSASTCSGESTEDLVVGINENCDSQDLLLSEENLFSSFMDLSSVSS